MGVISYEGEQTFVDYYFRHIYCACDANDNEKVNQNNNSEENSHLEEITFVGESDNWKVDLQFVHKDKQEEREFKLTYKGEDVDSVEEINYEVQGSGRFDHKGAQLNDEGYVTDSGFCEGCAFEKEETEIDVTVEWNGKSESFRLDVK